MVFQFPNCVYPMKHDFRCVTFNVNDTAEYKSFCNFIREFLCGDCHAVTCFRETETEILFNSYEKKMQRDAIIDQMIRYHMIEHIHASLLADFHRKDSCSSFSIYMFPEENAFRVHVDYEPVTMIYTISFFSCLENEAVENSSSIEEMIADFEYDDDDTSSNPLRQKIIDQMMLKLMKLF